MITQIFLLLLHLLQCDCLRNILNDSAHQVDGAASPSDSDNRKNSSHIFTDRKKHAIIPSRRIGNLCFHPFRLTLFREKFHPITLPLDILIAPLVDRLDVSSVFFNIISILRIIIAANRT